MCAVAKQPRDASHACAPTARSTDSAPCDRNRPRLDPSGRLPWRRALQRVRVEQAHRDRVAVGGTGRRSCHPSRRPVHVRLEARTVCMMRGGAGRRCGARARTSRRSWLQCQIRCRQAHPARNGVFVWISRPSRPFSPRPQAPSPSRSADDHDWPVHGDTNEAMVRVAMESGRPAPLPATRVVQG